MKCPLCGKTDDKVIESRQNQSGTTIRRRRECISCGYRFTSYEHIEEVPIMVIKRSGRRESFDLKKIEYGVQRALEKRPVPHASVEELLHIIEDEAAMMSRSSHEIRSETIGDLVLENLFSLDKVAYVRFASVYRQFENVEEFIRVIDALGPDDREPLNTDTGKPNDSELFQENI
ncbi:MAG: transcriptional regulator NrdR [Spirochaetes bacterium]|nr:MAG: transcriptional regulator NrdR [Spirochaetota bacterium]RKX89389.1 MAG: transcriptional regulator NrdR [Spirochaetota bacterium]